MNPPAWALSPEELMEESIIRGYLVRRDDGNIGLGSQPPEDEHIIFKNYYQLVLQEIKSKFN